MTELERLKLVWDKNAAAYDDFAARYPLYRESSQMLVDCAGVQPGMVVVDLGCGSGISTEIILAALKGTGTVHSVDLSSEMLALARTRIRAASVHFWHAPAEELGDVVSQPVDRILCNFSFWQFRDKGKVLGAASMLLKPNGLLVLNSHIGAPESQRRPMSNEVVRLIVEEMGAMRLGGEFKKRSLHQECIGLEDYGLFLQSLQPYYLDLSFEQQLALYRIPCMREFLSHLSVEQCNAVLDAVEEKLRSRGPGTVQYSYMIAVIGKNGASQIQSMRLKEENI
jgi:ubiquinone/menaquinone biosynthesis C-methylase UbiE